MRKRALAAAAAMLMLAAVVLAQLPDFRKKQAVPAPEN